MALCLLIDECTIQRDLLRAIESFCTKENVRVDVLCVGDVGGPAPGTLDPELIQWSIRLNRAIVSHDTNTMIGHYHQAVKAGQIPPPLFIRRSRSGIGELAEAVVMAACVYGPPDYGRVIWIPE